VAAVENDYAAQLERVGNLVGATRVVVVVPEYGDDRNRQCRARVGEHGSLFGQTVGRQVAREQDDIGVRGDRSEHPAEALTECLRSVDVSGSRDPDSASHLV
jgi:hypothetical protein